MYTTTGTLVQLLDENTARRSLGNRATGRTAPNYHYRFSSHHRGVVTCKFNATVAIKLLITPSGQLRLQNLTVNETDGDDNYNNYLLLELIKCQ